MCWQQVTGQVAQRGKSILDQRNADRQNKYNNKVLRQTIDRSTASAAQEFAALEDRALQERALAAQEIQSITAESRNLAGQAKLQGLESDTGGQSMELLLADFERSASENIDVSRTNLSFTERQLQAEKAQAAARRDSRIAEATQPVIYGPYNSKTGAWMTFLPA